MKPTAFFITTARGPVHDEAALLRCARRAADRRARASMCSTRSRRGRTIRCCTWTTWSPRPHTAGITVEAARDIAVATATQWQAIFDGRMPPRLLNPDVWPRYCERFHDDLRFPSHRPSKLPPLTESVLNSFEEKEH